MLSKQSFEPLSKNKSAQSYRPIIIFFEITNIYKSSNHEAVMKTENKRADTQNCYAIHDTMTYWSDSLAQMVKQWIGNSEISGSSLADAML